MTQPIPDGLAIAEMEGGGELLAHTPDKCYGEVCCLHSRTKHGMRTFPQHWRSDRKIMERICPHGIGHPDPDDYALMSGRDPGVHGCDGCCRERKAPNDQP